MAPRPCATSNAGESAQAINVSVSTQFSSRLDLRGRGLLNVLRASVHVYNTEEELDRFVATLAANP